MKKSYIILCITLAGCGLFEKPSNTSEKNPRADLQAKFDANLKDLAAASDQETGWPSLTDCDATLWCGIDKAVGGPCKIELAEQNAGEVHRRPKASGECYDGHQGATVSPDMLTGYLMGVWAAQDLAALQRLADYGEARHWTMGEGDATMTLMRPNGVGLLGRMLYVLSKGAVDKAWRGIPPAFPQVQADYEKHLQIEGIELNGDVNAALAAAGLTGALGLADVNDNDLARLKQLSGENPDDALAQAAYGSFSGEQNAAFSLLLGTMPYPTYVRGTSAADTAVYQKIYWLRAAQLVLEGK